MRGNPRMRENAARRPWSTVEHSNRCGTAPLTHNKPYLLKKPRQRRKNGLSILIDNLAYICKRTMHIDRRRDLKT